MTDQVERNDVMGAFKIHISTHAHTHTYVQLSTCGGWVFYYLIVNGFSHTRHPERRSVITRVRSFCLTSGARKRRGGLSL